MMSMAGWNVVLYPEKLPVFDNSLVIVLRHPKYQHHLGEETATEIQSRTILMAMAMTDNNMTKTAARLGIVPGTLRAKLKQMGLKKMELSRLPVEEEGDHGGNCSVSATREIGSDTSLANLERWAIIETLNRCNKNFSKSARELRIGKATLYRKVKQYGIEK